MAKRIFVGNLPYDADSEQLSKWFKSHGFPTQTVDIRFDRVSGQPRGYAYIEISENVADDCIRACNGRAFHGRTLIVTDVSPALERRLTAWNRA